MPFFLTQKDFSSDSIIPWKGIEIFGIHLSSLLAASPSSA
jgi:hypothetical protein